MRAQNMDHAELRKAIRPVARRLCQFALAAIEKQNRMLPLAMDMRLEGLQGEARVHFELYQCRNDAWHLDRSVGTGNGADGRRECRSTLLFR